MKLVYFLYLLRNTNFKAFLEYSKYVSKKTGRSRFSIIWDVIKSFLTHNTAFIDYFYFGFHDKTKSERASYADTLFMYRFQKKHNDKASVEFFSNKANFHKRFKDFITHQHFLPFKNTIEAFNEWMAKNRPDKVIAKNSQGQAGTTIEKFDVTYGREGMLFDKRNTDEFLRHLKKEKMDLVEVFIEQHSTVDSLYNKSVNTIRAITFLDKNNHVHFLGTILRMGTEKSVDNFHVGGVSAKVNMRTGVVEGPVIYKDPRKSTDGMTHPTTGKQIVGVQLPFWKELLEMTKKAALEVPQVRTVGWDVVLTENGPALLEGNHNWDKVHWQLCLGKGLKASLTSLDN